MDGGGGKVCAISSRDGGKPWPHFSPAPRQRAVFLLEQNKVLRNLARSGAQAREKALFLIGVVIDGSRVEVAQYGARRGARVGVDVVLREVPQQSSQRGKLPLDPAMARLQHAERIVESRRGSAKQVQGHEISISGRP